MATYYFVSQGFYQHFARNIYREEDRGATRGKCGFWLRRGRRDARLTSRRSRSGKRRGALRRRRVPPAQASGGGCEGRVWGFGVSRSSFPRFYPARKRGEERKRSNDSDRDAECVRECVTAETGRVRRQWVWSRHVGSAAGGVKPNHYDIHHI